MRNAEPPTENALFWTFAIAALAAIVVGLAARVADRLLADYQTRANDYAMVRVLAPESDAALAAAAEILAESPSVRSAAPMSRERAAGLLRGAGGGSLGAEDLPPLRLIEIELAPGAVREDISGDLTARLAQAGVTAEVLRAPVSTGGSEALLGLAPKLAAYGAISFAVVLSLITGLAARGIASRRANLIQIMADLGATRQKTSNRIGDEAGAVGFGAGLLAAVLVSAGAIGLILTGVPGATWATLPHILGPLDILPVALAPFLSAFVAGSGARAAADSLYAEAARLA